MSNPHDRDEKLLAGAFHDDWIGGSAAEFARAAAALARRRRTLRRAMAVTTVAAAAIAAVFVALRPPPASLTPAPDPTTVTTLPRPAYELISDDELLSRVHDLPMLVVRKPDGTKQITLLTPPPAEEPPRGE